MPFTHSLTCTSLCLQKLRGHDPQRAAVHARTRPVKPLYMFQREVQLNTLMSHSLPHSLTHLYIPMSAETAGTRSPTRSCSCTRPVKPLYMFQREVQLSSIMFPSFFLFPHSLTHLSRSLCPSLTHSFVRPSVCRNCGDKIPNALLFTTRPVKPL